MVVFEPVNQISRARNTGAAAARGEWLLFVDADSRLDPINLRRVVALARADEAVVERLGAKLRDTFALRMPVRVAAAGTLPRHEFKSNRWRKVASESGVD